MRFAYKGFPSLILDKIQSKSGIVVFSNTEVTSLPNLYSGNLVKQAILTPSNLSNSLVVVGFSIISESNNGECKIYGTIGGVEKVVLPAYFSNFSKSSASSSVHVVLDPGTDIELEITGSNGETFVGISYYEI